MKKKLIQDLPSKCNPTDTHLIFLPNIQEILFPFPPYLNAQ